MSFTSQVCLKMLKLLPVMFILKFMLHLCRIHIVNDWYIKFHCERIITNVVVCSTTRLLITRRLMKLGATTRRRNFHRVSVSVPSLIYANVKRNTPSRNASHNFVSLLSPQQRAESTVIYIQ